MPVGIEIIPPREFAANTVAVAPELALEAVAALTARLKKPPVSVDAFPAVLRERYGMDEAVALINDVRPFGDVNCRSAVASGVGECASGSLPEG